VSFADTYLRRYASGQVQKLSAPDPDLFLIVVIPVFNEPGLLETLNSLISAEAPGDPWEIIIVLNEPAECKPDAHNQNLKTIDEVRNLKKNLNRPDLNIHLLIPEPFTRKKAGPGMARKIGMDESLRRFSYLNRPGGVLVSFDGDTLCSSDYLTELAGFYQQKPEAGGCTVYFEHDFSKIPGDASEHLNAIVQYELYLRYFKLALEWITYPYANYALGSAFSVSARRYVLAGGMGLQKAGEDFYFLQKCLPGGNFWELNSATVFPSSRTSDRVVFGTGPFISDFIGEGKTMLDVFALELFKQLKPLFIWISRLCELPSSLHQLDLLIGEMPDSIKEGIMKLKWEEKIRTAYEESAGHVPFRKRFYHEISVLQIIRLMNDLSVEKFSKLPVQEEIVKLLDEMGFELENCASYDLLESVRKIEKSKGIIKIT